MLPLKMKNMLHITVTPKQYFSIRREICDCGRFFCARQANRKQMFGGKNKVDAKVKRKITFMMTGYNFTKRVLPVKKQIVPAEKSRSALSMNFQFWEKRAEIDAEDEDFPPVASRRYISATNTTNSEKIFIGT